MDFVGVTQSPIKALGFATRARDILGVVKKGLRTLMLICAGGAYVSSTTSFGEVPFVRFIVFAGIGGALFFGFWWLVTLAVAYLVRPK
jgi:hypothetical protein